MKPRPIKITKEGQEDMAHVPLARNGERKAIISREDYEALIALGVSPNWQTSAGSVVANSPAGRVMIGRLLMDAKASQQVRYKDGNPLNLRRSNLFIKEGGFSIKEDLKVLSESVKEDTPAQVPVFTL